MDKCSAENRPPAEMGSLTARSLCDASIPGGLRSPRSVKIDHESPEFGIPAQRIQQRVLFIPRIAGESCAFRFGQPVSSFREVSQLRVGRPQTVRQVVVYVATIEDRLNESSGLAVGLSSRQKTSQDCLSLPIDR